jgi:hypothetical protein
LRHQLKIKAIERTGEKSRESAKRIKQRLYELASTTDD